VLTSKAAPKIAAATIDSAMTSRQVGFLSFQYVSDDMRKSPVLDQTQFAHVLVLATRDTICCEKTHKQQRFISAFLGVSIAVPVIKAATLMRGDCTLSHLSQIS